ncbi:MAG: hypothetical protein KJ737_20295 [Proteobacteria bacterium]|nr:hypothetical protein [Pseudomonadota bacterium]
MKNVTICLIIIFFLSGGIISCDYVEEESPVVVDPCQETPNCIPDVSDWKLHYKPYNSDCMKCHTTCTPNAAHTFCVVGDVWNITDDNCLKCHPSVHQ